MALFFFVTSMNQNENGKGSIVTKTTSFQMLLVSLLVTLKGGYWQRSYAKNKKNKCVRNAQQGHKAWITD